VTYSSTATDLSPPIRWHEGDRREFELSDGGRFRDWVIVDDDIQVLKISNTL